MTRGGRDLFLATQAEPGERLRYNCAFPIQLAPGRAALFAGLELVGGRSLDYAAGVDLIPFDCLDDISTACAIAISRNERRVNPHNGEPVVMQKFPMLGGFVPLDARLSSGESHPHAGTGFGVTVTHGVPVRVLEAGHGYDGRWVHDRDVWRQFELCQLAYDGELVRVTRVEHFGFKDLLPGVTLFNRGMANAVADGEDLLFGMQGSEGALEDRQWATHVPSGVVRWRRGPDGAWRPVAYVPVTGDIHAFEPSLVRDVDGALLFTARQTGPEITEKFTVFVWRSQDKGASWELVLERQRVRAESPVTINRAADGTVFIAANLLTCALSCGSALGYWREILTLWPLTEDRRDLGTPHLVRCGSLEWGPAGSDRGWNIDHAKAHVVQLADGEWHALICYRVMDRGETSLGLPPTPHTGCYVDEVLSAGPTAPPWDF